MNLDNKRILFAAQYSAPYAGNFIASLSTLEKRLMDRHDARCAYLFPHKAGEQAWIADFMEGRQVYFSGDDRALIGEREADEILDSFKPDLVHTHFEGYDIPLYRAVRRSGRRVRQVWHMHDALKFHPNALKAAYQVYCFSRHYGRPMFGLMGGVKPCVISVCEAEARFIRPFRLWKKIEETVIPNGINLSRITSKASDRHSPVTFLAFGGRNIQKRTDLLVQSAAKLAQSGIELKVIIVGQEHTRAEIESICGALPSYVEIIKPREDINEVFGMADCFVSTSVHETFSYAIAEATIFGLPVIQSDIAGTAWNAGNPSTFLFKSEDTDDLARKMLRFINTPQADLRAKCEETAQTNAAKYSLDVWADRVIAFFNSIS